jgi:hypothetical protein
MKRVFALATVVLLGLCLTAPVQAVQIKCPRCGSSATVCWYSHMNEYHAFKAVWSDACESDDGYVPPTYSSTCPQCNATGIPPDSAVCNSCPAHYPAFWYA